MRRLYKKGREEEEVGVVSVTGWSKVAYFMLQLCSPNWSVSDDSGNNLEALNIPVHLIQMM